MRLKIPFKQQGSNTEIKNNRYIVDSEEEQIGGNHDVSHTTGRAPTQRGPRRETSHVAEQPNTKYKRSGVAQGCGQAVLFRNKRQYVEAFTSEDETVNVDVCNASDRKSVV